MVNLQKSPFVSSGLLRIFQGVPQWLNNWTNSWALNLNGEVGYGYSENDNTIYLQYGAYEIGWASIRYWAYRLEIVEETLNPDNSITAKIDVTPLFWESTEAPSRDGGYVVDYVIKVNDKVVWTYHGMTIDDISKPQAKPIQITTTIQPESYFTGSLLELSVSYPNGEAPSSSSKMGYRLYNPNPKYKPWGVRKGTWKSLTAGWFKKRTSGSWQDKGQITQNKIRKSGTWKNQGKLGN